MFRTTSTRIPLRRSHRATTVAGHDSTPHAARRGIAAVAFAGALLLACATRPAGLELIITTDLKAPDDYDTLQLHVSQEGTSAHDDIPFMEPNFPVTFAIAAGRLADQEAIIDVSLTKAGSIVVSRQAQVQVPKDRVAELTLVLGRKCVGVTCQAGETCDPQPDAGAGACVPIVVDQSALPTFTPGPVPGGASSSGASPASDDGGNSAASSSSSGTTVGNNPGAGGNGSSGSAAGSGSSGSGNSSSGSSGAADAGSSSSPSADSSLDAPADVLLDAPEDATIDVTPDVATCGADGQACVVPVRANDAGLVAFYAFVESSGTVSADGSGNGETAAMVGATFSPGVQGNAAAMNGIDQYVELAPGIVNGLTDFSVCVWVNLNTPVAQHQHIFDFGTAVNDYMSLTPNNGAGILQFAITAGGVATEQTLDGCRRTRKSAGKATWKQCAAEPGASS